MGHPSSRAERRVLRHRIIVRRVQAARDRWCFLPDLSSPHLRGIWASWNPFVCCSRCQYDDPRPAPWRWDGVLSEGDLLEVPARREGMSDRVRG